MNNFLIYANADVTGNIVQALTGFNVIPDREYEHYFELDGEIDITKYKLENGELVLK